MLVLALVAALQAAQPSFSFREVTSDLTHDRAVAEGLVERCRSEVFADRPVTTCWTTRRVWQGGISGQETYGLNVSFYAGGLAVLDTAVLPSGLAPVESAFAQKFGEPCERREASLTNAFGATVQQRTTVWCLSDGKLEVSDVHPKSFDRVRIVFVSDGFMATPVPAGTGDC
jgi:hypothetical protein